MREKLIELLKEAMVLSDGICRIVGNTQAVAIGHYLFAHGVTIPVRCKDCKKRYEPNECPMCVRVYGEQHDFTQENGYCDRGERRSDAETG